MNGPIAEERVQELAERHRRLHEEVSLLERRVYLTPEEQRHVAELKKQKLIAKDELYEARRHSQPPLPS
ncbi:MAG TPA: YdcH family protein [Polyangiaceae bacterium]|nr:YdcH family protein [Polyangiaceae bacterium]